jgi:hypothetical protein
MEVLSPGRRSSHRPPQERDPSSTSFTGTGHAGPRSFRASQALCSCGIGTMLLHCACCQACPHRRSSRQQQREQQRERMQQARAVWSWQVAHALASSASTKALQQVSISVAMSTSVADTIICSLPELQELHVGIGIPYIHCTKWGPVAGKQLRSLKFIPVYMPQERAQQLMQQGSYVINSRHASHRTEHTARGAAPGRRDSTNGLLHMQN